MKTRNVLAGAAALSLAAAPAIAQVQMDRAAAPVAGESEATGTGIVLECYGSGLHSFGRECEAEGCVGYALRVLCVE